MFRLSHLSATGTSVRVINQNLAVVDVVWNMMEATNRQGNPWPNRRGLMNLIIKDEGSKWAILTIHNMDLPAIATNQN